MTEFANPTLGQIKTRSNGPDLVCVSVTPPIWAIKKVREPKITFGSLPHADAQDMDGWRDPSNQHFHLFEDGEWIDQTQIYSSDYFEGASEPPNPYPGLRWRNTTNYLQMTFTNAGIWVEA